MANQTYVLVDPHLIHFKKILKKVIKREKNYMRYEAFFDFLMKNNQLAILRTGKATLFMSPFSRRIFLSKFFNRLEFWIWIRMNKIDTSKVRIYNSIAEINKENEVIFDFAYTWKYKTNSYISDLVNYEGLILVHMTHYFQNTKNIFDVLSKLKKYALISEGEISNTTFFRKKFEKTVIEFNVPFTIDHLIDNDNHNLTNKQYIRRNKCLIIGSITKHNDMDLKEHFNSIYLNQDRSAFRYQAIDIPLFEFDPPTLNHDPKKFSISRVEKSRKEIKDIYPEVCAFFTGVEDIGLPSINTFEGMFYGAAYIGPDDEVHKLLGLKNGQNFFSYKSGDFLDFMRVVQHVIENPKISRSVATCGQIYVKQNFNSQKVYNDLLKKVDIVFFSNYSGSPDIK